MIEVRTGRRRAAPRPVTLEDRVAPDDLLALSAWTLAFSGFALIAEDEPIALDGAGGPSASRSPAPLPDVPARLRVSATGRTTSPAPTWQVSEDPEPGAPVLRIRAPTTPQGPRVQRLQSRRSERPGPPEFAPPWRASSRFAVRPDLAAQPLVTGPGIDPGTIATPVVASLSWPVSATTSPSRGAGDAVDARDAWAPPTGVPTLTSVTPLRTGGVVDIDGKDADPAAAYLDELAEDDPGVLIQEVGAADRATLLVRQTGIPGAKRVVNWDPAAKIVVRDPATNQVKVNGFKVLEAEGDKEYVVSADANMALNDEVTVTLRAEGGGAYLGADTLRLTRLQFRVVNPGDTNGDGDINDDATSANRFVGNEFTFSTASPGVLTLPVSVQIRPDSPATREKFRDKVRLTVDAIGDSHGDAAPRATTLAWDRGASLDDFRVGLAAYDPATKLWTATATFTGMPLRNSDFGVKSVTARLSNVDLPEQSAQFEVFWPLLIDPAGARDDANFAKNHPGADLNAVRADSANQFARDATRAPNWFFYWRQAVGGTGQDRYGDALAGGVFGQAPAVRYFQNGFTGRHDRVLIFAPAQGVDPDPDGAGPRQQTTGIDAYRDTFIHENFHATVESVEYTNEAFGANINGASLVVATAWSFNIARPAALPVPPLNFGGARINNHYRDVNNDGDFADSNDINNDGDTDDIVNGVPENEDMDRDGDSVPNWADPTPGVFGPGTDLANRALNAEPDVEDALAAVDWGNPGKNHATRAYNT